jgi:NAD+ synthase (glutamine-hydrolysing)
VLDTEITPELVPTGEDEEIQSSEATVGPCAAGLLAVPGAGTASGRRRSRSWPGMPGATPTAAVGRPASGRKRPAYSLEIRHWLQVFAQRFYSFSQFKRSALPNGPRCRRRFAVAAR